MPRWICCLFAALVSLSASAAVTVSFVQPDRYTDAGDWDRNPLATMLELRQHLQQLGARYLPPAYALDIAILDVKLAGAARSVRGVNPEVRVLTGDADWPRIELAYTLRSGATVVRSGRETLVDHAYLRRIDFAYASTTPLPYEKRMLDEWFDARFGFLRSPSSH